MIQSFGWSRRFALLRIGYSFVFCLLIVLLPGLLMWMASLDKPGQEIRVVAGVLGFVSLACLIHARRYWMRLFDRRPQIEIHPGFLRARQWGDVDLLWRSVRNIRGQTQSIGSDVIDASIFLKVEGRDELELDTTGLDQSTERILETAIAAWRAAA